MFIVHRIIVWLSRIHHCRGFGIQSPTDYAFVRYVVNEHWPYYAYSELDALTDDWLVRKLGRLYFRLANWRQPQTMTPDEYQSWWQAGCRKTQWKPAVSKVELGRIPIENHKAWEAMAAQCDRQSVVVVEGIWRDRKQWENIVGDPRVAVTFDLYYCGIVLFDSSRHKKNYIVNF